MEETKYRTHEEGLNLNINLLIEQKADLLKENERLKKSVTYWEKLAQTGASMIDEVKDIEIADLLAKVEELKDLLRIASAYVHDSTLQNEIKKALNGNPD